jgi:hypothetical protein
MTFNRHSRSEPAADRRPPDSTTASSLKTALVGSRHSRFCGALRRCNLRLNCLLDRDAYGPNNMRIMEILKTSLMIIGIVFGLALIGLAAVVVVPLYWLASFQPKRESRIRSISSPERRSVFEGTLPMSVFLRATGERYHSRAHLYTGEEFWKTFMDGPWKWDAQQRFAGAGLNTGHYFAFRDAAHRELSHYAATIDTSQYDVLAVKAEIDNILDLTSWEHMSTISTEIGISEMDRRLVPGMLVCEESGGNWLTDAFGLYAHRNGYSGIVFYSARALDPTDRGILLDQNTVPETIISILKALVQRAAVV